jgi:4-hydroxybutyrate dehydrogenase
MILALTLPRLVFGAGCRDRLPAECDLLGISRPLLISDRGLEGAGVTAMLGQGYPRFLDVPENPTAAGVDLAVAAWRAAGCDGIIALGGGSVLDTAKLVAALAFAHIDADALIGRPDLIGARLAPLIAIPTTIGTGSESSPVAALHRTPSGPPLGTRSHLLVPCTALCDPDLARSLPAHLIAATGIDALSHCIEGFFAEPAHPMIDALALDGIRRVFAGLAAAMAPAGNAARLSLMAAAFAGGVAIHKGLGPAHAFALACGDQHVHHGTLVGIALPHTTRLLARHLPEKAAQITALIGADDICDALEALVVRLGLPTTLTGAGYRPGDLEALVTDLVASPFNRTSPYVPTDDEYRAVAHRIMA